MSTPSGTPDWANSIPGGQHVLLHVDLAIAAGIHSQPLMQVTPYSGLYLEIVGTSGLGVFVEVAISFADDPQMVNGCGVWKGVMTGANIMRCNVPVLGPYAIMALTASAPFTAHFLSLVGHNGGPSSSVRPPQGQLAGFWGQALAAGASAQVIPSVVTDGPAHLTVLTTGVPARLQIQATDAAGSSNYLLAARDIGANTSEVLPLWLPAQPLILQMGNAGAAGGTFYGGLWAGRP